MNKLIVINSSDIQDKIFTIRGMQVMIDEDLAKLYQVEPKRLNEQVKRNIDRFPEKFRFQLTKEEYEILRSQFATLNLDKSRGTHRKYLPYVFTEQGVSMLSAVLRSKTAIEISIKIIDSFVNMRRFLQNNASIFQRLDNLETTLTILNKNQNINSIIYTSKILKQLKLDIKKYNQQYKKIELKRFDLSHDRFLIIYDEEVYHIGASLKDLGKKWFAFSKIDIKSFEIVGKLK